MKTTRIINGTLLTSGPRHQTLRADLYVTGRRISHIGTVPAEADTTIDASGCVVIPGFVQSHIHLCQTLFRGAADDLELLDWLRLRIWPMEAAHTPDSLRASAQMAIGEMMRGGTTAALTMETVKHTEAALQVVEESGFRAVVGKCMMDKGAEVPAGLQEKTDASLTESVRLIETWHGRDEGRVRMCFAPRFAISCTDALLREVGKLAAARGVMVHTHASENRDEIAIVEGETGLRNIAYLDSVGITGAHVGLAHCIWVNDMEQDILAHTHTHVLHCPSSNLKLGSGIAPIVEMRKRGISVSIGADGAPCTNRLDAFTEMRSAALLQKMRLGSQHLTALEAFQMATWQGACAIGQADEIGSLEIGKRADLAVVNLNTLHAAPHPDPVSALVYAAAASDVRDVLIDGRMVVQNSELKTLNEAEVLASVRREFAALTARAGIV
ncbi:MAG: 5'-deoxyadenosine deaminase [Blastocatellia bacterium]|nr:5'-deoxyadenosine deaminase [Blastocatellia bacterium]